MMVLLLMACSSPTPDGLYVDDLPARGEDAHLYALSNDNDRYQLLVTVPKAEGTALHLGGQTLRASQTGSSEAGAVLGFELDRPTADLAAAALDLTRQDRAELGQGLRGHFSEGADGRIAVTITLEAGDPVVLLVGGAAGGVRDEQFRFEATADGTPLPVKPALGFGRAASREPLQPGESLTQQVDLSQWFDLPGGPVTVRCAYRTEVQPAGGVHGLDDAHRRWDKTFEGTVQIAIP